MNPDVAFEVDEIVEEQATSIVLRGRARRLEEDEEHRAENLPLRPWVATAKWNVVEVDVTEISGRRFELSRPWTHITPD
jgi:nitroimidazol reductase NimA-like FMN-containing flavoprotein (pyridoxamine 5'-phosphate oxidase superfamily)